ncbi:MAG: hypothetical protein JNN08_24195 [Bryobacterales bacterium]|nr:hypothetical protein [Bryobacterales bacterium]
MWARRAAIRFLVPVLLLPFPALLAPHVSEDPIAWAYKVYHPFLYRYPNYFASVVMSPTSLSELRKKSPLDQSLELARLMIQHW